MAFLYCRGAQMTAVASVRSITYPLHEDSGAPGYGFGWGKRAGDREGAGVLGVGGFELR